ncbi:MAG: 2,3,4,5-tetrahydropyridine-2,6-dicarboxylate N-succinyltransferase [Rickettsiales bacterium]
MKLETTITTAWESRDSIGFDTYGDVREAVNTVIDQLDAGTLRVANKENGAWVVNQWVKQAILLSFRLHDNRLYAHAPYDKVDAENPDRYGYWWDKVPSKFAGWNESEFRAAGFRAVPGCYVRRGSFVAPKVVLMPSFINLGAYVGEGTMVDTWVTIGSCAQIGKNCHISGGVGIGGVLEPLQANPVIIEDHCFIGARSEIAEGVIVEEGSVISMGVFIGASTKIVDRATGEVMYGRVPAYSVVVPGTLPGKTPDAPHLAAAIIVKRVDEKTRSKTSVNELLRD